MVGRLEPALERRAVPGESMHHRYVPRVHERGEALYAVAPRGINEPLEEAGSQALVL